MAHRGAPCSSSITSDAGLTCSLQPLTALLLLLLLGAPCCHAILAIDKSIAGVRAKALQRIWQSGFSPAAGDVVDKPEVAPGPEPAAAAKTLDEMLQYCEGYEDMYQAIHTDLVFWKQSGITQDLLRRTKAEYTTGGRRGVVLGFIGGKAYVLDKPQLPGAGHHANIMFTYMLVMLDLERQFGSLIPDVEFVIATSDRPMAILPLGITKPLPPAATGLPAHPVPLAVLPVSVTGLAEPPPLVLRFCSSVHHADVQIPIFHFYTKKYTRILLDTVPERNAKYSWETKREQLFGRFSKYSRHVHPHANSTLRVGKGGRSICATESPNTMVCRVRQHLIEWSRQHPALMDIRSTPMLAMHKHAQFKYLLHVDGQALSSRLEQLMPLNSLIFKEESGYTTFFHHLIKPHIHYVPFWKRVPEEILDALQWARTHDSDARRIANAAQEFALKYLNKSARACYWFRLFKELGALMRYQPHLQNYTTRVPVGEYLDKVARHFEGGRYFFSRIE